MSFKLIVISSPNAISGESELIGSLFKAGLKIFHLRKPGMSKVRMKKLIASIPKKYHSRIVIHSNHSLLNEFSLKGIHFSEKDRSRAGSIKKSNITRSASFHLGGDTLRTDPYDYILMSPVFKSISKPGYKSDISINTLKRFLKTTKETKKKNPDLLALGGVSEKNILKVKAAGFQGAALLGAIWMSKDPLKSFQRVKLKL